MDAGWGMSNGRENRKEEGLWFLEDSRARRVVVSAKAGGGAGREPLLKAAFGRTEGSEGTQSFAKWSCYWQRMWCLLVKSSVLEETVCLGLCPGSATSRLGDLGQVLSLCVSDFYLKKLG